MSTISASTTSTTAYKVTADTTGALVLQTGSGPTTAVTVDTSQNVTVAGNLTLNNGAADGAQLTLSSSGYSNWNWDNYSGRLRAYYNVTEYFTIDTSGNVGIGTNSPSSYGNLAVASSSGGATINIRNAGGANYIAALKFSQTGSGGDTRIQSDVANDNLQLWTAATERMRIDSSGNLRFNSGYGSVAIAYGCRAWISMVGTGTISIRGSANVSSIVDDAVGNYTINFSSAMPDTNYSAVFGANGNTAGYAGTYTQNTGSIKVFGSVAGGFNDVSILNMAIFR